MGFTIASKTLLLLAAAAVSPSQAAIAAWWNGIAPQIILQNTTTGAIRHSACNVFGTPTYSYTDGSELPLDFPPKNGTPLAGVGYWNEVTTIASVYYVEKGGALANVLLECNMATGLFRNSGNRIISTTGVTVSNNSGLAALLLGATGGYRVYFNDADMAINEIGYTRDNGWEYRGIISRDPQGWGALGAQFTGQDNITVASARDIRTMEAVRYHADGNWRISTLPYSLGGNITTQNSNASSIAINETAPVNFTLAAWTGKPRSLGVAINSEYTRSIWYIGSDRALYSVQNKNFFWSQQTNQSDAFWPLADEPNGELGIASQFSKSMVRIYYFVKGQLAEIKYEGGSWKSWAPVGPNKAVVSNPPTSSGTPGTVAAAAGSSGLSTGAKAGVGVGVALGVIAMCVLGATLFLMRKRKKAAAAGLHPNPLEHPSPVPPYGSPAPGPDAAGYNQYQWEKKDLLPQPPYPFYPTEPAQLDATGKPTELDAPRPTYELPDQTYSHELMGDSNTKPPTQASQPGQQAN